MYIHDLDPVLLKLGALEIRYYGLVYVFGFLLAWYILYRKREELSLSKDDVSDLIFYIMLGVIIGSRIFHILFWQPAYYFSNPLKIFAFWEGGMAFHGGLAGVFAAVYYYYRKKKLDWKKLAKIADVITMPAVFALALGRIANFINGELWGTVTNVPWCVRFPSADGCRHPVQLYSAAKRFIIFFVLIGFSMRKHKPGFLAWLMVTLFSLGRLFIDFFRENDRLFGLSMGQYMSLMVLGIGIYVLIQYYSSEFSGK